MHPANLDPGAYLRASKIASDESLSKEKKEKQKKEWEEQTGHNFPSLFPKAKSLGLGEIEGWEDVVTDPASCTKGRIS